MERITGSITALSNKTWKEHTRKVRPFNVDPDMPWVDVVDMAIERTFPESHFEQHEDDIRSDEHLKEDVGFPPEDALGQEGA